jgi:hypothetical protein
MGRKLKYKTAEEKLIADREKAMRYYFNNQEVVKKKNLRRYYENKKIQK